MQRQGPVPQGSALCITKCAWPGTLYPSEPLSPSPASMVPGCYLLQQLEHGILLLGKALRLLGSLEPDVIGLAFQCSHPLLKENKARVSWHQALQDSLGRSSWPGGRKKPYQSGQVFGAPPSTPRTGIRLAWGRERTVGGDGAWEPKGCCEHRDTTGPRALQEGARRGD